MVGSACLPSCVPSECCSAPYYSIKPEKNIDSWTDLLDLYKKYEECTWKRRWVFRGHAKARWCLETTLERAIRRQCEASLIGEGQRWEHRLLRQFQRIAPMYLNNTPEKNNWVEWLALMRHYGGPARLLDWTYSFFVAVFLATEKAEDGEDCAIWALDADWWKKRVIDRIPALYTIRAQEDPHSEKEFQYISALKEIKGIWPVNAFRLNERLHAQQGVFLMPLDVSHSFMHNLRDLAEPLDARDHLWKIVISANKSLRKEFLTELQRMNIHNQTLFRGLGGLAADLENYILMPEFFVGIEPKI